MIRRPGPTMQLALAMVATCSMLVLLADLLLGVFSSHDVHARDLRNKLSNNLAVQVASMIQSGDSKALENALNQVVRRTDELQSVAVRRADGQYAFRTPGHDFHWQRTVSLWAQASQSTVPLRAGDVNWGQFELAFTKPATNPIVRWLKEPLVLMMLFLSLVGTPLFYLYMRRALQHLDPASVVPERVQSAFDAMSEGVVIVDSKGRVLLTSKSFRGLSPYAHQIRTGASLSEIRWLSDALPEDATEHPWALAMANREPSSGAAIIIGNDATATNLIVNCAPIKEPSGSVRGCLVTFSDVSELHRSNSALRASMEALAESRQDVEERNKELQRLATRDPLTGCLNRRALHESLDTLLDEVMKSGGTISCIMADIDKFKGINDNYGHAVGDRVIQEVSKCMFASMRSTDLVCRYGGEEFCVIMIDSTLSDATVMAEAMRKHIESNASQNVRGIPDLSVTASLGVNAMSGMDIDVQKLIDGADQMLYKAKRGGRNRVEAVDEIETKALPNAGADHEEPVS